MSEKNQTVDWECFCFGCAMCDPSVFAPKTRIRSSSVMDDSTASDSKVLTHVRVPILTTQPTSPPSASVTAITQRKRTLAECVDWNGPSLQTTRPRRLVFTTLVHIHHDETHCTHTAGCCLVERSHRAGLFTLFVPITFGTSHGSHRLSSSLV